MRLREQPAGPAVVPRSADRRERHGVAAFAIFVVLFCGAFSVLLAHGYHDDARRTLSYVWFYLVLAGSALFFAKPSGDARDVVIAAEDAIAPKSLRIVQLSVCGLVIAAMGLLGALFDPAAVGPAWWSFQTLFHFGAIQFCVDALFVFVVMRALKVRPAAMGLGHWAKGSWLVALICASMPVVYIGIAIATPQQTFVGVLEILARNVFQNGFSEEFLFRGVLLGRLRTFMRVEWAVLVQALVFGAWHFGTDSRIAGGKPLVTLALMISIQAAFAFAVGYLSVRTRSIAAGTIFHILLDASRLA